MTPTMKLRFVERRIFIQIRPNLTEYKTVRVLQQQFATDDPFTYVWVDVPLETEE